MFSDYAIVSLGAVTVKVRRLTVKEIRENRNLWQTGKVNLDEECDKIIREHVVVDGDKLFDPSALSLPQMQKLVAELVGLPEKSTLTDFIGLLS